MSTKPAKSKTVVLRLPQAALRKFPHEATPASHDSKLNSSPDSTPAPQITAPSPADTPADPVATMNDPSTPSSLVPPASGKRKGPAPKKRSLATAESSNGANGTNGTPKPRGKPGPKTKKQKMGDVINDPNNKTPFAAPTAAPKVGPKANQGAINANLRALDRTGKFKVRRWEKKGLKLRSFTGVVWQVPSYIAPPRGSAFSEDVRSDSTGSTDTKLKDESSAISADGTTPIPPAFDGMASSPAPVANS